MPTIPRRWSTAALILLALGILQHACVTRQDGESPPFAAVIEVTVNPAQEFQTIHNFGASDAWSLQFVGANWPAQKQARIADLLFSLEEQTDGSPVGIGLSAWRFNIGAGSAAQGEESGIGDRWRRADAFVRSDGSFDPAAQPGQRAFLRAARARGVEQFYAFSNSPPVTLTRNGRAHSSGGDSANLARARIPEYAAFLARVVAEIRAADGVEFAYLSPFNEPQWEWKGGQEGSPWQNHEVAEVTRAVSAALLEAGLSTQIEIPETAQYDYVYGRAESGRGVQAHAFFSPDSPAYVGDLPNVAFRLAAHSYFTTYPADTLRAVRQRVHEALRAVDPRLELLTTEYCILENNERIRGSGRDLGIEPALYMAEVMHADLVDAGSSGWQWWLGVSPYDYKDGLVYIDRDTLDGAVYESKMLWGMGHFSRFVRPGMRRIAVEAGDSLQVNGTRAPLLVSAYRDPASARVAAVLINRGEEAVAVRLRGVGEGRVYRTTDEAGMDLRYVGDIATDGVVRLPPLSLTTVSEESM